MAGGERIFVDAQWFKRLDNRNEWSVFNRTRATVDYNNSTNLFTGSYLNYTTKSGLGGSLVGKVGSNGAGVDAGVHLLKISKSWTNFLLISVGAKGYLEYSWFSITRFIPTLTPRLKLYSSLELFTLYRQGNHLSSVQRIRLGLQLKSVEFGAALNLAEAGPEWDGFSNVGGFFRRSF